MADKISVLLVDDHSLVRRGFRRMLEDEEDIRVVGEASDGEEAFHAVRSGVRPCLILLDLMMPKMDGFQFRRDQLRDPTLCRPC